MAISPSLPLSFSSSLIIAPVLPHFPFPLLLFLLSLFLLFLFSPSFRDVFTDLDTELPIIFLELSLLNQQLIVSWYLFVLFKVFYQI